MVSHGLAVLLALLAAVFLAIGIVVRQRATMDVAPEHSVSAVMVLTLLRRPLWWAGTAAAVTGFCFQAFALVFGSLLLVQPILVSALLFALHAVHAEAVAWIVGRAEVLATLFALLAFRCHVAWRESASGSGRGIALVLLFTVVGIPLSVAVLIALSFWLVYRIARGWLRLVDRRPMYV